ncbi:MAG TPA: aminotransferase class I/II-fold pyridoxal phosphate-dependent enzyme [Vicinamibacterales bacterium]|nr:aminotransferase class I/II-fold pyridoxal phosphate-dependent enzyme [Vicinamibacterales bacterium]
MNIPAPYMRWAKTRPRVSYDLASSGLLPVTTTELLGDAKAAEAFDISGPTDEGFIPLREAIASRYGTTAECVSIAAGASGANFQAMLALLEPGDDALIETPAYDPLIAAARAAGANVVHFERNWSKGFALDPYVVRTALTPATKLIVISNAHNPSGAMANRDALEQVGVMAEAVGARVLVDEVYAEAQHDGGPMPRPAATIGEVFVSTNSLTKAYGLAGLRCGWIMASPAVSSRVRAIRDVIDGSGSYVAERLSLTVFENIDRLRSRARKILADNLAVVRAMAASHSRLEWLEPVAGTTAFPRVTGVNDTSDLVDRLIRDHDTIVVPGYFFQAPQHIRIAYGGKTEMIREAIARLDLALRE